MQGSSRRKRWQICSFERKPWFGIRGMQVASLTGLHRSSADSSADLLQSGCDPCTQAPGGPWPVQAGLQVECLPHHTESAFSQCAPYIRVWEGLPLDSLRAAFCQQLTLLVSQPQVAAVQGDHVHS